MREKRSKFRRNISQTKVKIITNKKIIDNFYKMSLAAPKIAKSALPGQFLNIKVNNGLRPLLRKPLGISRVKQSRLEVLYKVVGEGTEILSQRASGEYIDILGPLGNSFPIDSITDRLKKEEILIIAGGIGIAPLLFLTEQLIRQKRVPASNISVLIGSSSKKHILLLREFKALGAKIKIATEDASSGFKGKVTELAKNILKVKRQDLGVTIYVCGPRAMLKETASISSGYTISCFGLLEEYMACGTGACFGCVVATTSGYKRVCKDGPVFDLKSIKW